MLEKFKRKSATYRLLEEQLFKQVVQELSQGQRRDGLWGKALANSNGSVKKADALYIKYRVQSIKDEMELAKEASNKTAKKPRGISKDVNPPKKSKPKSLKCPFSQCAGTIAYDGSCLSCGHKWNKEEIKECCYCNKSFQKKDGHMHPTGKFVCRNCERSIANPWCGGFGS